jgi:VWFA-related protein
VTRRLVWLIAPLTLGTAILADPAGPTPPQTQQPTFRAETNLILRDVRVRDNKGSFVYNLTVDDFELFEDGVLQKITQFQPYFGGRPIGVPTATIKPRATEGLILPQKSQNSDMSGRIFIIFIDDLHFLGRDTMQVRQIMMQIRDKLVTDQDLIGIVSSGYSSIETDLVYDFGHKRLNEAIEKTMGSGMSPKEIISAAQTSQGPAGLRFMTHTALSTVNELLEKAQMIPSRRKAFIYISNGYDFDPFKDSRLKHEQELYGISTQRTTDENTGNTERSPSNQGIDTTGFSNPFSKPGNEFAEADLISEIAEVIRMANRANVALYTIDPRGLIAGPSIEDQLTVTEYRDYVSTSINSLRALSDNTGGFCACNTNDYGRALERINNETSDYYMLGYQSSNPDPLKIIRKVEIKVKRSNVTLDYAKEYFLKRPDKRKAGK